jgi:hypothetical protein
MYARVQMTLGSFVISHLVFAGMLVITPALRRAFSARSDVREWPAQRAA